MGHKPGPALRPSMIYCAIHYTNFYILTSEWFNYYKYAEYISLYCTLMHDYILKLLPVGYGVSRLKSCICAYRIGTKCPSVYVEHCTTSDRSGLAPLTSVCLKERPILTDASLSVFLLAYALVLHCKATALSLPVLFQLFYMYEDKQKN
jgi:hypothetical protein